MSKSVETVKKNWKTSVIGLVTLAIAGFGIYHNPTIDTATVSQIGSGLALLLAEDPKRIAGL
jgi:hypothetical protein